MYKENHNNKARGKAKAAKTIQTILGERAAAEAEAEPAAAEAAAHSRRSSSNNNENNSNQSTILPSKEKL